jgi:hypothetical protein
MKLYHRTGIEAARAILCDGFRDGRGTYLTVHEHEGVWLSDCPLDENEGAEGPVLFSIKMSVSEVRPFEWVEDGKGYREFLVPAALVNSHGAPRVEKVDPKSKLSCSCGWSRLVPERFIESAVTRHRAESAAPAHILTIDYAYDLKQRGAREAKQ